MVSLLAMTGYRTFYEIIKVSHLKKGNVSTFHMTPEEYGFSRAAQVDIKGGNAGENASIIRTILDGEKGPKKDMVLLNAAAAFVTAGLDNDFNAGIERARDSIDSGRAKEKLRSLVNFTQRCKAFVLDRL